MEPLPHSRGSVLSDGGRLHTASASPGTRVYGERLVSKGGVEYREWNPRRSKLAAYLALGGGFFPFRRGDSVLYLGAASGTTASHVSDIVPDGAVYCVEYSARPFRDLVAVAETRGNMVPVLGDAASPEGYAFMVPDVDVVYSDVAQKGQARILAANMRRFGARFGMLCLKARSEDVTADPRTVFSDAASQLAEMGMDVVDVVDLGRYERDHAMICVEMPRTAYCVAVSDEGFLMVRNPARGGWEMPGGKLERGESAMEGAARECLEESGYAVEPVARMNMGDCDAVACRVLGRVGGGEMEPRFFRELPGELSFPVEEYEGVLEWAASLKQ
ncbi:MAG: fibrillarin-like rRNA/tRNA 2'-O-methyltransferase [Thermoplasmatales archaeon]|nr:fibrillarin-like rRNA/tRNA 2'-O-methyltransferase [Thermoplasmatales archaeon]